MTREACVWVLALALAGCTSAGLEEPPATTSVDTPPALPTDAVEGCPVIHPATRLPEWARGGFSDPDPAMPHVLGDQGDIAAILWAARHPLSSPPAEDRSNKILWVARVGAGEGPLRIKATLRGTGQTTTRTVEPAPGPSIIDMPSPGCWLLDLEWGQRHDHLQLAYVRG